MKMTLEEDFKKFEKSYKQYYGKKYDKALNNLKITKKRLKDMSLKRSTQTPTLADSVLMSYCRKPGM